MIAVLLRALVAVVAAMAATPAHADPVTAVVMIFQGIAAAGGIAAIGLTAAMATYIAIGAAVIGGVLARQKAKRAAAAARNAQREALQERCVVLQSSEPSPRIIYGRCAVGGDVFDRMSSPRDFFDDNGNAHTRPDGWQHVVIGIAHHECQALHRIHINGVWYDITGDGYIDHPDWRKLRRQTIVTVVTFVNNVATIPMPAGATASIIGGMLPSWTISGNTITGGSGVKQIVYQQEVMEYAIRVEWHSGAVGQAASSYLRSLPGSRWTAKHRLDGIAYVVLSLNLDDSRLQGGLPQDLSFDVSGRKILDPRTGLTAWSDNTALIVHDWLRSEWGYSLQSSDIDTAATIAAANACDVVVGRPTTANASATGPFSRCNGTFRAADDRATVLADLCEQMAGFCAHGETWSIAAGVWSAPVMSLTDDDLAAPIQIQRMATPLDEAFNSARASIIKAGSRDPSDVPPYANAAFVAADGEAQWQTFTLPFCGDPAAARHLMRIFCEQSRAGQIIQYPARMRAWPLQPGDRVTVTDSMYGMAGLTYRVIERTWAPGQPVLLTLQRDTAATYDSADATSPDPAPATSLPSPGTVDTPSGLVASSGNAELLRRVDGSIVPRVRISWAAPVTMYMTGPGARTEVSMRRVGDDAWQTQTIVGGVTTTTFDGAAEGDLVILRVRHVNSWGVDSPWVLLAHVVVGKTAAPTAPTALAVAEASTGVRIYSVTHAQDIDHAGYEIRCSSNMTAAFSAMTTVVARWEGAAKVWESSSPDLGTYRFAAVAVDSSGNLSVPVYTTQTVGDPAGDADGNLVDDGYLYGQQTGWSCPVILVSPAGSTPWTHALQLTVRDTLEAPNSFRVRGGEVLYVSADITAFLVQQPVRFGVMVRDSAGVVTAFLAGVVLAAGSGWTRLDGSVTIPANAVTATPWLQIDGPGGQTLGQAWASNLSITRAMPGAQSASLAQTAADAAATAAAAKLSASSALTQLQQIGSDGILSGVEKKAAVVDWSALWNAQAGIVAQANALGIVVERDSYTSALTSLANYLTGLVPSWADTTQATTIIPAAWRGTWDTAYQARQALLNRIAAVAATRADYAMVSGKPESANICWNGDGMLGVAGWAAGVTVQDWGTVPATNYWLSSGIAAGRYALTYLQRDSAFGDPFGVAPGEVYSISGAGVHTGAATGGYATSVGLILFRADGSIASFSGVITLPASVAGARLAGQITIPPGVATAQIWVQVNGTTGFANMGGGAHWTDIDVRRVISTELLAPGAATDVLQVELAGPIVYMPTTTL